MLSSKSQLIVSTKTTPPGLLVFFLVSAIHLYAIASGNDTLRFWTKPLLMPLLGITVFLGAGPTGKSYLGMGLIFSFLGDTLLLFESKDNLFFIFGLAAFLITHLFYILYFFKLSVKATSVLMARPYILVLILAYGAALIWTLYPSLGALRLPVMVYAVTICIMLAASVDCYRSAGNFPGLLYISGAVLFVISDSLLAINKFYLPFTAASFFIMFTYCAAQFCIVRGFLSQQRRT